MFLSFLVTFFLVCFSKRRHIGSIPGYAAHGANTWMGQAIATYPGRIFNQFFRSTPLFLEVKAQDVINGGAVPITPNTDPNTLVTTTDQTAALLQVPFRPEDANIPLNEIGVLKILSTSVFDRAIMKKWEDVDEPSEIYAKRESAMAQGVTVGEWNRASGMMTVEEDDNGVYIITHEICGIRGAAYHVMDFGSTNTLVEGVRGSPGVENFYSVPGGGMPDIIVTDEYGYGKRSFHQLWNPLDYDNCGFNETCHIDYNIVYHWDASIYGASSGLESLGYPGGIAFAIHIVFPTGVPTNDPANKFMDEKCGYRSNKDDSTSSDSSTKSSSTKSSSTSSTSRSSTVKHRRKHRRHRRPA